MRIAVRNSLARLLQLGTVQQKDTRAFGVNCGWDHSHENRGCSDPTDAGALTNTRALGELLYTRYIFAFQAAGVILLVAMIGAIVLTLRARVGVRHQSIARQLARTRAEAVEVVKVPIGGGVGD